MQNLACSANINVRAIQKYRLLGLYQSALPHQVSRAVSRSSLSDLEFVLEPPILLPLVLSIHFNDGKTLPESCYRRFFTYTVPFAPAHAIPGHVKLPFACIAASQVLNTSLTSLARPPPPSVSIRDLPIAPHLTHTLNVLVTT